MAHLRRAHDLSRWKEFVGISQAHTSPSDSDPAAASRLEAQVKAIQAVAAAIDRLAAAVEALSPPSPPPVPS